MEGNFFALYDRLLAGIEGDDRIDFTGSGDRWCMAGTASGLGLAMNTPGDTAPLLFPGGLEGLPLAKAAQALKSWNFREASFALAAVNAWYNSPRRLDKLGAALPAGQHYTHGLNYDGMCVGIVGHMKGPADLRQRAGEVYILERCPEPGDYPDSACEYILPRCDLVIITGSSIINKTLPRLLELSRRAYVILTGPSVPLCPALLDFGVDRLAGLVVDKPGATAAHVSGSVPGSPYHLGQSFLLSREG